MTTGVWDGVGFGVFDLVLVPVFGLGTVKERLLCLENVLRDPVKNELVGVSFCERVCVNRFDRLGVEVGVAIVRDCDPSLDDETVGYIEVDSVSDMERVRSRLDCVLVDDGVVASQLLLAIEERERLLVRLLVFVSERESVSDMERVRSRLDGVVVDDGVVASQLLLAIGERERLFVSVNEWDADGDGKLTVAVPSNNGYTQQWAVYFSWTYGDDILPQLHVQLPGTTPLASMEIATEERQYVATWHPSAHCSMESVTFVNSKLAMGYAVNAAPFNSLQRSRKSTGADATGTVKTLLFPAPLNWLLANTHTDVPGAVSGSSQ